MIDSIVWSNGSVPSSREHEVEMIRRKPLHTQQIDSLLLNNRGLVIWTYMNFRYLIIQFDSDASLSSWISCPAVCSASSLNLENSSFFSPFSAYTFWLSFNGLFFYFTNFSFLRCEWVAKRGSSIDITDVSLPLVYPKVSQSSQSFRHYHHYYGCSVKH